jgi:hypothetical protein
MLKVQAVKRVPWTCKWGRFGGPVRPLEATAAGFVFWMCSHPNEPAPQPLPRGCCEQCPFWEMPDDPDA